MKNLGDFLSKPRKSLSDFYFTIKSYLLYIKLSFSLFSHSDLFLLQWTTTSISSSMTPFLLILLSFVWGWMKCFSSKMVLLKDSVSQSISSSSWTWDMLYSFHSLRLMSWNGGQWLLHFFLGFSFFRKMDDMNDTSSISSCSSTSTMVTSTTTMSTATETFLSHSTFKSKQGKKKTKKKSCSSTRSSSHSIALPTSPSPLPPSSPTLLLKTSTRTLTPPPKVNLPNTPESSPTYLTRQLTYPLTTSSYSFPKKKTFSSTPFSILPSSSTHPTPPLPLPSSSSTSSPSPSPSPSPLPPLPPLSPPLRTSTTPFFSSSTSFDTMAPWMRKTSSFKRTNSTSTVKKQISSLFQLKRHQGQEPTTLSPFQYSRKNEPLSSSLFSWSPLPECFFHLPPLMVSCLLELDLSHLHLSSVPEPIQYLSQLQILRLHSNCIGSIPPFLAEFKRLKMLDLHGNQILSFHAPWIRNFVSLHLLDLSNNCLSFFSPYFAFLPYLQLVLLHQNPWQTHSAEIDELTQTYSVTTCFSPLRHSLTSLSSCKTTDSAIALHTCFYTPTMLFRSLTQVFPISLPLDEQYSLQLKSFLSMLRRETEENTFHPFNPSISHEFSSGHSNTSDFSKRTKVIEELLTTECTYIQELEYVIQHYKNPILNNAILSRHDTQLIFTNLDSILSFHRTLYTIMQKGQPQLGWVFLRHLDFFKMYTEFINGFDVGMELLEVYTKKKKAFAMFLESCRKAPGHNQVNLQAYLLLPIQRIPRYQLLLSQLLKYTPSDHPDFTPLTLSVKGIQKKANELNEAKRAHENHFQLIKLVLRLPPPFDLLLPHRKLWRQGSLFLWKCKANNTVFLINLVYHFALFNDLFLQLKKPSRILSLLSPTTHPSSISSSSSSSMSTSSPLLLPPPSSPPLLSVSSPRTLNSSTPFTSMPSSSPSTSFPSPSLSQSRFSNPRSSSPKWMPSTTPSNSMFRWFQSPKSYPRKYQVIQAYSFDQRPPSVFLDAQAGVLMVQFFETELYFQDHGQNLNAWWADFQRILLKP